ncbi:MAG: carbohydrate binding domain-containing protein [Verrucomicrobiia bacterium]
MKRIKLFLIGVFAVAQSLIAQQVSLDEQQLFPFVLPWDDSTPNIITEISSFSFSKPAGKDGYITVGKDGHFYAGKNRIRFFGVNMSFSGGMPETNDAARVAGRLAKFGINVVRFHHMDTGAWPNGICDPNTKQSGELSSQALERLDFFINELKSRGVYANLNLLVGRRFNAADGLPPEIEKLELKDRHIVGFFHPKHLELQKEYARKLLTHRNPFTKLTYAEDPAVAFVEINNEQGLIHSWLGNNVDNLPEVFLNELKSQWNQWLKKKYKTTASLRQSWSKGEMPLGSEMLKNNSFENGLNNWTIEQHSGAKAAVKIVDDFPVQARTIFPGGKSIEIEIVNPGVEGWHIQLNQNQIQFKDGQSYTLSFYAKASQPRQIAVSATQAHDPWANMGLATSVRISTNWAQFTFTFVANKTDDRCRIGFSNFGSSGKVSFAAVSLKPGGILGLGEAESIESASVPYFTKSIFSKRTKPAQLDWMEFLSQTEDNYWQSLYKFIKNELKVQALVTGTIVGCAPPNLMAKMDWVDTHSYWQHPRFPGRPWDSENWIVENRTMVNERGGTLPGLALKRIYGKPHACTEYNHPAPNTFSSEGFLLLAAYASLQDWDAIYVYSYAHTRPQGWDSRKINGFFDIDQHPTKMVSVVPASALFLRNDVKPANQLVVAQLPFSVELDLLRKAQSWRLVDGGSVGIQPELALIHKVALLTEGIKTPAGAIPPDRVKISTNRFVSDTGELIWDLSIPNRGIVTFNTPRSKAVIGYGAGRRFDLGEFSIEPGENMQNGWSAITFTRVSVQGGKGVQKWLLTATGYAQNTGMKWKNAEKSSVGRNWGTAPSLVEGIAAKINAVKTGSEKVTVWALDERGNRKQQVPVNFVNGAFQFSIGPKWQTLWYELQVE